MGGMAGKMGKERPILMTTESVKAILGGRKTQTRRVVKPQPLLGQEIHTTMNPSSWAVLEMADKPVDRLCNINCPYGQVGDRLWVRETWAVNPIMDERAPRDISTVAFVYYKAISRGSPLLIGKWRPSIFMPRWASRLTLEITRVRVERLQEITEEDAIAEGIEPFKYDLVRLDKLPVQKYRDLWDSLNAKRGYSWETNPWVWVIKFDKIGAREK